MRIGVLADTHEKHHQVDVPTVDVLIHAGDFCSTGSSTEAQLFLRWWQQVDAEHKILIAGNHDRCFARRGPKQPQLKRKARQIGFYLQEDSVTINGVTFYGSPWTPKFGDWAFMKERGNELKKVWQRVPEATDVLVTHGPPYGIMDRARTQNGSEIPSSEDDYTHAGSRELREQLQRIDPDFHVFGHIHEEYGRNEKAGRTFLNASLVDEDHDLNHDPMIFEIASENS